MFEDRRWRVQAGAGILALSFAGFSLSLAGESYQPKSGQLGKDIVWVGNPESMVQRMLDVAAVTPQDYVVDLGSGDGRNVIAAAKRGARAHGIEYNGELVELSKSLAAKERVSDRAQLVAAIEEVARGGSVIDSKIVESLVAAKSVSDSSPCACLLSSLDRSRQFSEVGYILTTVCVVSLTPLASLRAP